LPDPSRQRRLHSNIRQRQLYDNLLAAGAYTTKLSNVHCTSLIFLSNLRCNTSYGYNLNLFSLTRAVGKIGLLESDMKPSIVTVTSADESDVDITEAVENATGT